MSRRRRTLGLMLAVGLCSAPAALAAPPVLTLSVAPRPGDPAELMLRSSSGERGRPVAFFVVSTEFGQPREVPIGAAATRADGTASIRYRPTWSGTEQFVARLAGPGAHAPAATASYQVAAFTPGPLAAGADPARPLASVGRVFLDVILSVVALVWLSLIVTLALALGRLPRLAAGKVD